MILKLLSEEITLVTDTGNTVSDGSAVRIYNDSGGDVLITRFSVSANANIGSTTMANNEVNIFEKNSDEQLIASANVKATSIAFASS